MDAEATPYVTEVLGVVEPETDVHAVALELALALAESEPEAESESEAVALVLAVVDGVAASSVRSGVTVAGLLDGETVVEMEPDAVPEPLVERDGESVALVVRHALPEPVAQALGEPVREPLGEADTHALAVPVRVAFADALPGGEAVCVTVVLPERELLGELLADAAREVSDDAMGVDDMVPDALDVLDTVVVAQPLGEPEREREPDADCDCVSELVGEPDAELVRHCVADADLERAGVSESDNVLDATLVVVRVGVRAAEREADGCGDCDCVADAGADADEGH